MDNLVTIFAKFRETCKKFAGNRVNGLGNVPRRGMVPKFSDIDVIALALAAEASGVDSEGLLFRRLGAMPGGGLPGLISRRQFNARRKRTARLAEDIRKSVARRIDGGEDVFCLDSKPVRVCRKSRGARCAMGVGGAPEYAPAWGYCASQMSHYYGYKLHVVCGLRGVVHSFDMTAADVHDIRFLNDVGCELRGCTIIGDRGYVGAEVRRNLFETASIRLEVPYRRNRRDWRPPSRALARLRRRVETVFSQLDDHLMMMRNYAKQPTGLFTRTAGKIAAMTSCSTRTSSTASL